MAGVRCEQCRGTPGERRCDGPLEAGLDLELREREPLSLGGEGSCRRRDALSLGERPFQGGESLARRSRPLREIVTLCGGSTRRKAGVVGPLLELRRARVAASRMGPCGCMLVRQPAGQLPGALPAGAEPLTSSPEGHERRGVRRASRDPAELHVARIPLASDLVEPSRRLVGGGALRRGEERVRLTRSLRGLTALRRRIARCGTRGPGRCLERADRLVGSGRCRALGVGEVVAQPRDDRGCRLRANREPLSGPLQAIQRPDGGLARACRIRQLDLGLLALGEHRAQPGLRRTARERSGAASLLGAVAPVVERRRGRAARSARGARRSRVRASRPARPPWPGVRADGGACEPRPRRPGLARPGARRARASARRDAGAA